MADVSVQREDLLIPQGATYSHEFDYVNSAGSPINITGYSARMQIRASISDATTLYVSDPSHFTISGAAGKVTLNIPASITTVWTFSRGVYDIELYTSGDTTVIRLVKGKVKVDPEVTR